MTRLWAGLAILSAAWLCLFPVFAPQVLWGRGLAFAAAGVALIAWSLAPADARQRRRWSGVGREIVQALWFCGIVLAWQFLALRGLSAVAANHHDLRVLSPMLLGLARIFGLPMTLDNGVLFFETEEDVLPFVTNWEKVGFVMPVTLLAAMTVAVVLSARSWKDGLLRWTGGVALLVAYTLVRYLILCGLLIEFGDPKGTDEHERLQLFTGIWPTLLSHLPFALLAVRLRLVSLDFAAVESGAKVCLQKPRLLASATASLAMLLGVVVTKLELPGSAKNGRVVVDDFHSGFWEASVPPLDTNGFGSQRLYNTSSLVEWLRYHYSVEVNTSSPISEDLLRNVAVLVLKTPTRRLTPEEIAILVSFVRKGGGLLLIGDHTNLLGMSSYLNEIASQFGIEFRYDASNAYSTGYFSGFKPPWLFAHPIVDRLPPLRFMTSCTLKYDFRAEAVIIAHDVISDPVDYSKPSFFGKLNSSPKNGFGLFPLAVARRYGQGRVLAFAESTTLSNFAVFQDGTAPFFLRAVQYLNQTNRNRTTATWAIGVAAFLLLGVAIWRLARAGSFALLCGLGFGGLAGYFAAGLVLKAYHSGAFAPPTPALPCEQVAVLSGPQFNYHLPAAIGPSFVPAERSFDALYVVPQRFGCFPEFASVNLLQPRRYRAAIAINPAASASPRDFQKLANYVAGGGKLLVFQEPGGERFLTNLLSHARGSQRLFEREFIVPSMLTNAVTQTNNAATMIAGATMNAMAGPGAPLNPFAQHRLTWSAWSIESGAVHVLSDSRLYSRAWLGNVMVEPSEAQQRVYGIVFAAFNQSLGTITRPEQTRAELR